MIRGTQGVPVQILHTFSLSRAVPLNIKCTLPYCTESQAAFINLLNNKNRRVAHADRLSECITVLGRPLHKQLPRTHYVALCSICTDCFDGCHASYYARIIVRGEIIHSSSYCRHLKRNSFTVQLISGFYFKVATFVVITGECYAIGEFLIEVTYQLCLTRSLKLNHFVPVSKSVGVLTAIAATDIVKKCVFVSLPDHTVDFVCKQVHTSECCS
jgi:hypothetical protein